MDAAEEVFIEKGYHDVSMDEIAAQAGIAKGTLYLHFPGKKDLVFALFERSLVLFEQAVEHGIWSWGDKSIWGYGQSYTCDDVFQAYRACLDNGLNFFDTAEIDGNGESERLLGECRSRDNRPIVIASKFAPSLSS